MINKLEDLPSTSYVTNSKILNRDSLKGDVKTDEYGRMLLD